MNEPEQGVVEEPQERMYFEVKTRVVEITPELATRWLDYNLRNRNKKYGGIASYSGDMADGEWVLTGETIKFDWFGNLIDGQHRLEGCRQSGKAFVSLVVWGIDPKAQDRMDSGMTRSFRDQLQIAKMKHGRTISAICRRVYLWEPPRNERINFQKGKISHARLEKVLNEHRDEIVHCAEFAEALSNKAELHSSQLAFFYWVLRQANPEGAPEFIHKMVVGAQLDEGDPILVLREWIRREKPKKSRDFEGEALWKTVLAWNAWMANRKIAKLQFPKGGRSSETFPRLRTKGRFGGPRPIESDDE